MSSVYPYGEIVSDLKESLRRHLQDKMVDSPPDAYLELLHYQDQEGEGRILKPALIRIGRLQDDPTDLVEDVNDPSILIGIHDGDPDDISAGWKHTIFVGGGGQMSNAGVQLIGQRSHEIGGGVWWWRRFVVEIKCYFMESNQTQSEAARLSNVVRGLVERYATSISHVNPHGWSCSMTDDLGETAEASFVVKSYMHETGGPDDDYIGIGKVWIQVQTYRS